MATCYKSARKASQTAAPKADIYAEVTRTIIEQLKNDIAPWAQPWKNSSGAGASAQLPLNVSSGRRYSGINILILWGAQLAKGYRSAGWMTFKQAVDLGAHVRKGEKSTSIVYADSFVPENEKVRAANTGDDARTVHYLKSFAVFNVEQIDGLDASYHGAVEPVSEPEQIVAATALIRASGADVRIGGDRAFFAPGPDFIAIPHHSAFHHVIDWNRTALHELTHWTGHASRLARKFGFDKSSKDYAREELVAEMGSAFLCASLGIVATVRHADYVGSWLTVLREDNRAIFRAASLASKAADYLLANVEG